MNATFLSVLAPAPAWLLGRRLSAGLPALLERGAAALVAGDWLRQPVPPGFPVTPFLLAAATLAGTALLGAGPALTGSLTLFLPVLAALAAIDERHGVLPDLLVGPLLCAGLAAAWAKAAPVAAPMALLGAAGGWAGAKLIQKGLSRRGAAMLGEGDVKLLAAIGAWLGPAGAYIALTAAFAAFCVLGLRAGRRRDVGFGPYLLLGSSVSTLVTIGSH